MLKLFTSSDLPVEDRFRIWKEVSNDLFVPADLQRLGDAPFVADVSTATIGRLSCFAYRFSPLEAHVRPRNGFRRRETGSLGLMVLKSGFVKTEQLSNTTAQRPGDICIIDDDYQCSSHIVQETEASVIRVPRERLERVLGSSRLYAGLTIQGNLPCASLARTFFEELIRRHETLNADATERLTSIGIDLLIASVAERMAMETPKPLQGTVTVQRAKVYIEAHLHDPTLDPPQVAAAMGVSVRRLQQLFQERSRHVSDWIWQRRLEVAAQRLADPGQLHLSLGALAYSCGFANQAHFSRRFKERYGLTPSDYRRMALR